MPNARLINSKLLLACGFGIWTILASAAQPETPRPGQPGAPVESSWLTGVTKAIEQSEYDFSPRTDGSWSAPNRLHGLRSIVGPRGVHVTSRIPDQASFNLQLTLARWGRTGHLDVVEAGALSNSSANSNNERRVSILHEGVTQWFVNDRRGLEQGFTVAAAPRAGDGQLLLELEIGGDVLLFPEGEDAVLVRDARGKPLLRYGGLIVRDAAGRELPAQLRLAPGRLYIEVDDRDAAYPLEVDPVLTSPAWTGEGNQDGSGFGWAVAPAGDVNGDGFSDVIVGAPYYDNDELDEGRAFVFLGSASGLQTTEAWSAEGNQEADNFGAAVASAGDVNGDGFSDVVVGAPYYDNGESGEGRGFVYHGSASGLGAAPAWSAEGGQAGAFFGWSVAGAGDVNADGYSDLIVGAVQHSNNEFQEGQVRVYHGSASGLGAAPVWTAESDQPSARFGISVATAGDVNGDGYSDVIVGAEMYDNGESNEGRSYVYHGSASGLAAGPNWVAEPDAVSVNFGHSVSTAGDVNGDGYADVIVGAPDFEDRDDDGYGIGEAFVYHGSAVGLGTTAVWSEQGGTAEANYGTSVATAGDVNGDGFADVIVGAVYFANPEVDEGGAFVYQGSPSGLAASPVWSAESNQDASYFGFSVATAGDVNGDGYSDVIAGANYYTGDQPGEGAAFVYYGFAEGLAASAAWTAESDQADAVLGLGVAGAGDVNGDGFSDVVVGAPYFDGGAVNSGRVLLYLGSRLGLDSAADWTKDGTQVQELLGISVARAGDVNGDGYSDVVADAWGLSQAFVFPGSSSGLSETLEWTIAPSNGGYGHGVATAGDVNGDGYGDVIVGDYGHGKAHVFLGSPTGPPSSPSWSVTSDQADSWFGWSVGSAGDVNRDGYSDVIVGALYYDNGESSEGRAYLYYGSAAGPASTPAWVTEGNLIDAKHGTDVASAGDLNGDGYSDVVVTTGSPSGTSAAAAYLGSAAGLSLTPAWTVADGGGYPSAFANSLASAGDVNGDGYSDVIIGDPYDGSDGAAFVYLGSGSGLGASPAWIGRGNQDGARYGYTVGAAGDINGDGFGDVIVSAHSHDNGQIDEGRAYVYYGNGGGGFDRIPRQLRDDGSAPIGPLGASDSETSFRLRTLGRTPAGRGRVRAQWEVKQLGTPFTGTALAQGSTIDTGAPGAGIGSSVALDETASGLLAGEAYRWRLRTTSSDPFFPRSRWFTLPDNNVTETDLRTYVPLTVVTFRLVDQNAQLIPASQFDVLGVGAVQQNGTVVLQEGSHTVHAYPGLNGNQQGSVLHREESVVVSGAAQTVELVWKTASLTVELKDQVGALIPGSQFGVVITGAIGIDLLTNSATVVLPVTEDPSKPPVEGPSAGGYGVVVMPGVNGQLNGAVLSRSEPVEELTESGALRSFVWKTASLTVELRDQSGSLIPGSQFVVASTFYFGIDLLTNSATVVLPVTEDPTEPSAAGLLASGYDVAVIPGLDGNLTGGKLYRTEPVEELTVSGATRSFVWKIAALTLNLRDQFGAVPAGSSVFVPGVLLGPVAPSGTSLQLPVTEDSSEPPVQGPFSGGYPVALYPGINGQTQGSQLFRGEPAAELTESGLTRDFVWKTAELTLNLRDQFGAVPAGSSVFVPGVSLGPVAPSGTSLQLPVTEDSSEPPVQGPFSGGYPVALYPGINGQTQGSQLFRGEPAAELTESGLTRDFVWKTAELTLNLRDQFGAVPAGSSVFVPGVSLGPVAPSGTSLQLPVTEDSSEPPVQGPFSGGYPAQLYPGINGQVQGNRLFRTEPATELPVSGLTQDFVWEAAKGRLIVVDATNSEVPGASTSGMLIGEAPSGALAFLPVTDGSLYPTIGGVYASGYNDSYLKVTPAGAFEGPFTFQLLSGGVFTPAFVDIPGASLYGLRFAFDVTSVSPPDNALDVPAFTDVTVEFNRPVSPATVTAATFKLLDPAGVPVPAAVPAVSPSGLQVTLDPDGVLALNTLYTVVATSGIEDLNGQSLTAFTSHFRTEPGPVSPLPDVSDEGELPVDQEASKAKTGAAVAAGGDLDGDNLQDVLAGAPGFEPTSGVKEAGAVAVYLGSVDALERATPDILFTGVGAHDRAGVSVAGDFDFNGDGKPDILIGAEQVNRTAVDDPVAGCDTGEPCGKGKVYLIYFDPADTLHYPNLADPGLVDVVDLAFVGQPGGIPGVVFEGEAFGDQLGFAVAAGGHLNAGTGDDILIGAPGWDARNGPTQANAGAVYALFDQLLSGTVSLSRVANGAGDEVEGVVVRGSAAGDLLGFSVAFLDGVVQETLFDAGSGGGDDAGMGSPGSGGGVGKATALDGGDLDTTEIIVDAIGVTVPGLSITGSQPGEQLGWVVSDGRNSLVDAASDVLIGSPRYDVVGLTDAGRVVHLSAVLPSGSYSANDVGTTLPGVIWTGEAAGDHLGEAAAGVGDVTGDGIDDVVLGAPYFDPTVDATVVTDGGAVYLVAGSAGSVFGGSVSVGGVGLVVAGDKLVGTQADEHAGSSVAGTGDIDGSGDADFAVGAPDKDAPGDTDAGTVYLVTETEPEIPGACGAAGCTVADLPTGAQLRIEAGALQAPVLITLQALLDPATLPAAPPSGLALVGAVSVAPDGWVVGPPAATIWLPVRDTWAGQFDAAELFALYYRNGSSWVDSGDQVELTGSPHVAGKSSASGAVDVLYDYAIFVADLDGDSVRDTLDNCAAVSNPLQANADGDIWGDACDSCTDLDGDGWGDPGFPANSCGLDNCLSAPNPTQADTDGDSFPDACDNCPGLSNASQDDLDGDAVGDACDTNPVLKVSSRASDRPDFFTIQAAVDAAVESGTRVNILPGLDTLYEESVLVDRDKVFSFARTDDGSGRPVVVDGGTWAAFDVQSTLGETPMSFRGLVLRGQFGLRADASVSIATRVEECVFDDSAETAIELGSGAHEVLRATMSAGVASGIHLAAGASLVLQSSMLRDLGGIGLHLAGDATVTTVLIGGLAGDGVLVVPTGSLALGHSTVAGNAGVGVNNPGGAAVSVTSSIVHGNVGGDLVGVPCVNVAWSDVGVPDCSAVNANLAADCLLDAGYLPADGSPCLEHGPDPSTYTGDPCLDLNGGPRLRDFDGDGLARVDPGAYERANPLLVPSDVALPRWVDGTTLIWDPEPSAVSYHVYRVALSALSYAGFATCGDELDFDLTDTMIEDLEQPGPGTAFGYMLTAEDAQGRESTLGLGLCAERSNFDPCP